MYVEGPEAPPADRDERGVGVILSDDAISVTLADGRVITVPYLWYPRLYFATPQQRMGWEWIGDGIGIHWEEIDEDIEVAALLHGGPAPRKSHLWRSDHPSCNEINDRLNRNLARLLEAQKP